MKQKFLLMLARKGSLSSQPAASHSSQGLETDVNEKEETKRVYGRCGVSAFTPRNLERARRMRRFNEEPEPLKMYMDR